MPSRSGSSKASQRSSDGRIRTSAIRVSAACQTTGLGREGLQGELGGYHGLVHLEEHGRLELTSIIIIIIKGVNYGKS